MSWERRAAGQAGVITRSQLREAGLNDGRIDRLIASDRLCVVARGVLRVSGAPETRDSSLWAAVLSTGGWLGYETAVWRWGCQDGPGPDLHVVVPHSRRIHVPPGVLLHRQSLPSGACRRRDRLPVCSRTWALTDVIGARGHEAGVVLADRALQQQWLTLDDVRRRLRVWPGRTGNVTLRRVLDIVSDGARAESERALHRLLRDGRLTGWEPNLEVVENGVTLGVADVAFRRLRIAVEVDGLAWHRQSDRFERDRERQNGFVVAGWVVLRYTWRQLTQRPTQVLAEIVRQVAIRERLLRQAG